MNNKTVTLRDIVVHAARKTSGQSVPFFAGRDERTAVGPFYPSLQYASSQAGPISHLDRVLGMPGVRCDHNRKADTIQMQRTMERQNAQEHWRPLQQ